MAAFLDNCKFTAAAGGTTDWTYSAAVSGYQVPSAAGVVNGQKYKYLAISADLTQWEIGEGAYNTSTGVLPRTTVLYSTNSNAKVSFTAAPTVAIIGVLEDLIPAQAAYGLGMANGTLVTSAASNNLTVAVKTLAGNDPSAADPVFFFFRDAAGAGAYTCRVVTSALNISAAGGASLGMPANQPFRLWVNAFDNAGTVVLGLWQSVTFASVGVPTGLNCLDQTAPVSTTAISSGATSPATHYTSAALTSKSFRILGYVEFGSGLATAGAYANNGSKLMLYSPGMKLPGDLIQFRTVYDQTQETTASGTYVATVNGRVMITPSSSPNLIYAECHSQGRSDTNGTFSLYRWSRGTANNTNMFGSIAGTYTGAAAIMINSLAISGYDAPGNASATTYTVQFASSTGAGVFFPGFTTAGTNNSKLEVREIMA